MTAVQAEPGGRIGWDRPARRTTNRLCGATSLAELRDGRILGTAVTALRHERRLATRHLHAQSFRERSSAAAPAVDAYFSAGDHVQVSRRDVASMRDPAGRGLPLSDVRVVSLEQFGAGPYGSLHLADLGAEVIKVEDPRTGGDVGRYVPPYQEDTQSLFFETFNRNKRSISLDLSLPEGREVFEDLVAVSDVVYSNLRGDVPAKLRIRYDDLKHLNPAIVCCCLSGFGMTGPRAAEPGYDYLIQGLAGWMSLTGEPDGPPTKTGLSLVDFSGGLVAAASILAGLHAAVRDGVGCDCDVSLYDNAMSMLSYIATWALTRDHVPERRANSAHQSIVPFQNCQTADGWIVIACAKEKFWRRLVSVLDIEVLRDDRFRDFAGRDAHRSELLGILHDCFLRKPSAEWLRTLQAAGVPCAPVLSVAEALTEPQLQARDLIIETAAPPLGQVRSIASPVRAGPRRTTSRSAPALGQDTDYVIGKILGYPPERALQLRSAGAFGRTDGAELPVGPAGELQEVDPPHGL